MLPFLLRPPTLSPCLIPFLLRTFCQTTAKSAVGFQTLLILIDVSDTDVLAGAADWSHRAQASSKGRTLHKAQARTAHSCPVLQWFYRGGD